MQTNETNQSNSQSNNELSPPAVRDATKQSAILAQIAHKTERKLKLRWILAISSLPLFGIFTAFGIAPQTAVVTPTAIVEEIGLPSAQPTMTSNAAQYFWYKERVRRDDTLKSVLSRLNIQNNDAIEFIRNDAIANGIASALKPGHTIQAQIDINGSLVALEYQLDGNQFVSVKQTTQGYEANKIVHPLENRTILKSAKIKSTLFSATDDANIPDDVAKQLAELFESNIDFNADLRRGDQLNVIYEGSYDQGELVSTGKIVAAEFTNNGKTYRAVGFKNVVGEMQYYTPEGMSLHKTFLRTPLEFTRISSGFSLGRFHPILQHIRAHEGTDFAAPIGTQVKASGDATVDFVGQKGGYGNVIVLKHENKVSTVYGHLSRFAEGLHVGEKVTQGELIGYVGMTGLATGPHLHYEFMVNGEHRDPMTVALPKDNSLIGETKLAFDAHSKLVTSQLNLLSNSNMASLD
ncbi:MAG: M23 family metallopeptidase [Methylophilaceae bacterium]